jgi:hypothetical protein
MSTDAVTPLRHRMIEDMKARKLCAGTQRGHIHSCKRFAAFLNRSPDTATTEDIRRFQLHLTEAGASICNRNRIMTGLRFLFRVPFSRYAVHLRTRSSNPPPSSGKSRANLQLTNTTGRITACRQALLASPNVCALPSCARPPASRNLRSVE